MKRKYTIDEYSDFIRQAEAQVPQIGIGTDVIVGFPGESDAHFERTVNILRELPIHYFHVFTYSPRHMAKSRLMETQSAQVIARRSQILRDLSAAKRRRFHGSLLGSVQSVLFEHSRHIGWQNGLTDNYVRVKVKDPHDLFNQILPVRLDHIDGHVVLGKLVV
jgi:threonylcarbamoyladenosine tRNA methylthiotransferase MtaB